MPACDARAGPGTRGGRHGARDVVLRGSALGHRIHARGRLGRTDPRRPRSRRHQHAPCRLPAGAKAASCGADVETTCAGERRAAAGGAGSTGGAAATGGSTAGGGGAGAGSGGTGAGGATGGGGVVARGGSRVSGSTYVSPSDADAQVDVRHVVLRRAGGPGVGERVTLRHADRRARPEQRAEVHQRDLVAAARSRIVTVSPCVGTRPANDTSPATGARDDRPTRRRRCPRRGAARPRTGRRRARTRRSTSPATGHVQARASCDCHESPGEREQDRSRGSGCPMREHESTVARRLGDRNGCAKNCREVVTESRDRGRFSTLL